MIDVLLVEDHPVVREGLRILLGSAGDVRVAGEAATVDEALALLAARPVHVVLLDLDLDGEDSTASIPRLCEAGARRVLVVTGIVDPERHRRAQAAGAHGLVTKEARAEQIVDAIRAVHAGTLAFRGRAERPPPEPSGPAAPPLTPREREIVVLLGEGRPNAEIAAALGISEKTVRNHLSAVFEKLGVADRVELVVYAYAHGLAGGAGRGR